MDYGLDYGGGGGGFSSGGGYGGGGNNMNAGGGSQSPPQKTRRPYDEQTLIPVTIQMINGATADPSNEGNMILPDGRPLATFKLIAAVRSVNAQTTNVMFTLEDGTGLCDVKQWIDDNNDSGAMAELRQQTYREHSYVKVFGTLKSFGGNTVLVASSVLPLSSGNELTHHMLEVVHTAETYKRADSIVAPNMMIGAPSGGPALAAGDNSMTMMTASATAKGIDPNLSGQIEHIMRTMGQESEEGVAVQTIISSLSNYTEVDIRRCIQSMSEDGFLYTTVDEEHYNLAM